MEQAIQLATHLNTLDPSLKPQFILSSPFYRCVETGKPIAETLHIPIVLERGVGEYYKIGRHVIPEPANYSTLNTFFPNLLVKESEWPRDDAVGIVPSLSGESPEDIFNRCTSFWEKFIPIFEQKYPNVTNVLVITHAATAIALGMSLLNKSSVYDSVDSDLQTYIRAGAASLSKYERSSVGWKIVSNGNTLYLPKGEEMNWDFHSGFEAGSDEDIKNRKEQAEKTGDVKSKWDTPEPDAAGTENGLEQKDSEEEFEVSKL